MNGIEAVARKVKELIPHVKATFDRPDNPQSTWWLDVVFRGKKAVVEWRPNKGFGISSLEAAGYGEGPQRICTEPEAAARAVAKILRGRQTSVAGRPVVLLKELRQRRRVSQEQLAGALNVTQATISKTERGTDSSVSTLEKYVSALGGELQIHATFPDEILELRLGSRGTTTRPRRKTSRGRSARSAKKK